MVFTRQKAGASRQLFTVDKSVRLDDNIRGKPTDPTTPVAAPPVATSSDTAGQKAARERYEAVTKLVQTIYDERAPASILRRLAECEVRLQEAEARRAADQKKISDLKYLMRNGN
eukprot:gene4012-4979_t